MFKIEYEESTKTHKLIAINHQTIHYFEHAQQKQKDPAPHTEQRFFEPMYVPILVIIDFRLYQMMQLLNMTQEEFLSVFDRTKEILSQLNVTLSIVHVEYWESGNLITIENNLELVEILKRLTEYNVDFIEPRFKQCIKSTLLLISDVMLVQDQGEWFVNVGGSNTNSICTNSSVLFSTYFPFHRETTAMTIAHEFCHFLGLSHDDQRCKCEAGEGNCVLSPFTSGNATTKLSDCSWDQFASNRANNDHVCALQPSPQCDSRIVLKRKFVPLKFFIEDRIIESKFENDLELANHYAEKVVEQAQSLVGELNIKLLLSGTVSTANIDQVSLTAALESFESVAYDDNECYKVAVLLTSRNYHEKSLSFFDSMCSPTKNQTAAIIVINKRQHKVAEMLASQLGFIFGINFDNDSCACTECLMQHNWHVPLTTWSHCSVDEYLDRQRNGEYWCVLRLFCVHETGIHKIELAENPSRPAESYKVRASIEAINLKIETLSSNSLQLTEKLGYYAVKVISLISETDFNLFFILNCLISLIVILLVYLQSLLG
ncbi:disintegrin and metalloproteinase domain-containing protein 9-like isoform X2 [Dinothrombium tinctorium]|nr:disintegrin and metalloproteinase domain-containing protein 9-like isoform X2 [Dinothrombium tinctorium]